MTPRKQQTELDNVPTQQQLDNFRKKLANSGVPRGKMPSPAPPRVEFMDEIIRALAITSRILIEIEAHLLSGRALSWLLLLLSRIVEFFLLILTRVAGFVSIPWLFRSTSES